MMSAVSLLKQKCFASLCHLFVSACVSGIAAAVVFLVWYPGHYSQMMAGVSLFTIVLAVELSLGPLMSLVIYNPSKARKKLVQDYAIVAIIQFAALIYGLYTVALSRPVFEVFVKDRFEVVAATQMLKSDLLAGSEQALPWFGPVRHCVERPSNFEEQQDLLFSALSGRDIHRQPRYYRTCNYREAYNAAYKKAELETISALGLDDLPASIAEQDFRWMPVVHRFGAWLAVFPASAPEDVIYLDLFPFME